MAVKYPNVLLTFHVSQAHWVWCQYGIDFLKQDGEWKVWHFRCLEVARAPFSENWITFAGKNQVAFDKVGSAWAMPCWLRYRPQLTTIS